MKLKTLIVFEKMLSVWCQIAKFACHSYLAHPLQLCSIGPESKVQKYCNIEKPVLTGDHIVAELNNGGSPAFRG